jgi:hypothetical protein
MTTPEKMAEVLKELGDGSDYSEDELRRMYRDMNDALAVVMRAIVEIDEQ